MATNTFSANQDNSPNIMYQWYRGNYEVDKQEQGYFGCNGDAWKGRLVSLVEVVSGPVRFIADTAVSLAVALVSAAVFIVAIAAKALTAFACYFTSFGPDSTIHRWVSTGNDYVGKVCTNTITALFITISSAPLAAIDAFAKSFGNVAGTILPEVGLHFRNHNPTELIAPEMISHAIDFS